MDTDPLSWTTAQVADFFRSKAASFMSDRPTVRLPDIESFSRALEENGVDGVALLKDVDPAALRDDFGIQSFGNRSAVVHCIRKLQAASEAHSGQAAIHGPTVPQTPNSSVAALPTSSAELPEPVPTFDPIGENVRAGEVEVQDSRGKKRRKLDLSAMTVETAQPQPKSMPAHYMTDSGLPIDEVFYGQTSLNREIGELSPDGEISVAQVDQDLTKTAFSFQQQDKLVGDSAYVYRQMRHFMMSDTERLVRRRGKNAVAILPYREELAAGKNSVSATVFRFDADAEDGAIAVRENAAFLNSDVDYIGEEQTSSDGQWDYLTSKWGHKGDEELPVYGEKSDDGDDWASDVQREIDEEEEEKKQEEGEHLEGDSTENMIDAVIGDFISEWKERKLPVLEEKQAWTVWKKMKGSKTLRSQLIECSEERIQDLGKRIQKYKVELLREEWRKAKELRDQCEVMRVSVDDRELLQWKISVWKRKQEPHHVVKHGQHQTSAKARTESSAHQKVIVHGNDRISVSPGPDQDDTADERFLTPDEGEDNEFVGEGDDGHGSEGGDEMEVDEGDSPLADIIEDSPPMVFGDASSLPDDPRLPQDPNDFQDSPLQHRSADKYASAFNSDTDHLPTMAEILSQVPKREPKPKSTPKTGPSSNSRNEPIVLSSDSTPSSKKGRKKGLKAKTADFKSNPQDHVVSEVRAWDMQELVENADRTRILIKLLYEAGPEKRKAMLTCMTTLRPLTFKAKLRECISDLQADFAQAGEDEQMEILLHCCKIYLAFHLLAPEAVDGVRPKDHPSQWLSDQQIQLYTSLLQAYLPKHNSKLFTSPQRKETPSSKSNVIDLGSDEDSDPVNAGTPSRKKKKPQLGAAAAQSQHHAHQRQDRFKALQMQSSSTQQLEAMIQSDPSRSTVKINILQEDDEDSIFVDKEIADSMKEHQVAGVQFMWRELTADGDGNAQGCILAHTMGLGKTMQAIAVLVTLNEAAQSDNPRVHDQLPPQLRGIDYTDRQLRMLVLCPASLVDNWYTEIRKWAMSKLRNVWIIESADTKGHLNDIEEWYRIGGILLIGYELFRNKVRWREAKKPKPAIEGQKIEEYLLNGPEIVVADEAHRMKAEKSGVSVAASRFETESRIALTGTPMSNNVQEIYSLVSWAAPEYLGDSKWFNAQYAKPIADGNGDDSTPYQVRKGIKRLAVLHRQIEPKINRAAIEVLRGSLPSKTEFVITIPLTELQRAAYSKYVQQLLDQGKTDEVSQMALFGYIFVLMLLTNHPKIFRDKMLQPKASKQPRARTPATSDSGAGTPLQDADTEEGKDEAGESLRTSGFSKETIDYITSDIGDAISAHLSTKMAILMEILTLSRKCGDKVLIFSYSIPTLDYLSSLCKASGINAARIDGSMTTKKRVPIVEAMQRGEYDVMLISTKAGGIGLNIQAANRVIILDSHWNPTHEQQAIGRAYRLGQKKPVFVYRFLVGGTFEETIYNKQRFKEGLNDRVVDKKNTKRIGNVNSSEILHEPRDVEHRDLEECLGKDDAVLDRIVERQRLDAKEKGEGAILIRDLKTMETLQGEEPDAPLTEEEAREVEEEYRAEQSTRGRGRKGGVAVAGPSMAPSSTAPAKSRTKSQRLQPQAAATSAQFVHHGAINGLPSTASFHARNLGHVGPSGSPTRVVRLNLPNSGLPAATAPQGARVHGLPDVRKMPPPSRPTQQ